MTSPYAPPTSTFDAAPIGLPALRWHGAVIFVVLPVLALLLIQGNLVFFEKDPELITDAWSQTFFLLPLIVMAAASGFACAGRLAVASLPTMALAVGIFSCLWGLASALIMVYFADLNGAYRHDPWNAVATISVRLQVLLLPLALVASAWTRRHGRVNGYAVAARGFVLPI